MKIFNNFEPVTNIFGQIQSFIINRPKFNDF